MQEQLTTLLQRIQQLDDYGFAIWEDLYGKTEFAFISSISPILSQGNTKFIVSDYLNYCIPGNCSSNNIVSIGGFPVHNKGKIEAQNEGLSLTTIPIPLSNDSFGTNRCSSGDDETCASYKCIYPSKVYFCIEDLLDFGVAQSINGIGEFIGLYYSYIDYCLTHNLHISDSTIQFIISTFREQVKYNNDNNHVALIRKIAIGLVFKCLMMRIGKSHEIGCEIDHFFARMYEDTHSFTHGKSVYLGSILSSIIFKSWDNWGLSTEDLIRYGIELGIIVNEDINIIAETDILQFVSNALQKRPFRATILRTVSHNFIQNNFESFKKKWGTSN